MSRLSTTSKQTLA